MCELCSWYKSRDFEDLERCLHHAERAILLDTFETEAQRIMEGLQLVVCAHDLSQLHFRNSFKVHPGNAHILAHAARYHAHGGAVRDTVSLVNKTRQLNPMYPAWYRQHPGIAMFANGKYRDAINMFSRLPSPVFFDRPFLAAATAKSGDIPSATRHLNSARHDKPGLTHENVLNFLPFDQKHDQGNLQDAYIAGLVAP